MAAKIKPTFLPSVFTSGNLFCGMYAIMEAMRGNSYRGAWFVILAAFFDVTDGFVARISGQASRFGVEFDSLCDVISFVLAPMLLLYPLCFRQYGVPGALMAFVFVVTGTIRLARFNVEVKSLTVKSAFHGLPTPAAGCLVASYLIFCNKYWPGELMARPYIPAAAALLGLLMVSNIEYPTFPKIASRSFNSYAVYGIMVLAVIGLAVRRELTLFPVLLMYLLLGIVGWASAGIKKMIKHPKAKRSDKSADC